MFIKNEEKILILTGRFGEGHQQAAKAIQEAAMSKYPHLETKVVDFMAWAYPNLYPVSHYVYMKGIKKFPQLYGLLFQKTYESNYFSQKLNSLLSVGIRKMLTLLQQEKPTVVVSTFPFTSSVFSKLKEYHLTDVPLVTVITDHTHHSYWLHPFTDQYIVGSKEIKEKMVQNGIPSERVADTGIPIRTRFLKKPDIHTLIQKYNLEEELPTVLIMGGGDGLIGKGFLNKNTLETISQRLQLIILCGHNEKLREQLEKELIQTKHRTVIKGFTDCVDELMAVSDLIVTKPGGVTTSEALAMGLPMLLYKPLPGQEQDNAKFLLKAGAALQADNPFELASQISAIIGNKLLMARMKKNANQIQAKKAAYCALEIIKQIPVNSNTYIRNRTRQGKSRTLKFKPLKFITNPSLFHHGR